MDVTVKKRKSISSIIIDIILWVIIGLAAVFLIAWGLGYEPRIVMSGSMEPTIKTGSICWINKNAAYEDIKEGDIIAFGIESDGETVLVTHRAINITEEGIETKGDNNDDSDGVTTTKDNFVGQNILAIPYIGYVAVAFGNLIRFLTGSSRGHIFLIMIIAAIIFLIFLGHTLSSDDSTKKKKEEDKKDIFKTDVDETTEILPEKINTKEKEVDNSKNNKA